MEKPPRSLKDFDYFAPAGGDAAPEHVTTDAEELAVELRGRRRRQGWAALLGTLVLAGLLWLAWGYRDEMAYALGGAVEPLPLGDVATLDPGTIRHNSYVTLTGITEHRGLTQKLMRGLAFGRSEYWYFRLLGSQGVFIEVEPDPDRYGFATEVSVAGRAIDPKRLSTYADLLATYHEKFRPRERNNLRIVQVGVRPGDGGAGFVALWSLATVMAVVNASLVVRLVRERRRARRGG